MHGSAGSSSELLLASISLFTVIDPQVSWCKGGSWVSRWTWYEVPTAIMTADGSRQPDPKADSVTFKVTALGCLWLSFVWNAWRLIAFCRLARCSHVVFSQPTHFTLHNTFSHFFSFPQLRPLHTRSQSPPSIDIRRGEEFEKCSGMENLMSALEASTLTIVDH